MSKVVFNIKSRLHYLFSARYWKGHRVHSPYVYHFLNFVLFEKSPYYCYSSIEQIRHHYLSDETLIELPSLGTGIARSVKVSDIVKRSLKSSKYAQLLFRIALFSKSKVIVELGSCLGVTSLYLASANLRSKVYTFEGAESLCKLSSELFSKTGLSSIELIRGNIDVTLPAKLETIGLVDLAFLDANHTYEATKRYYTILKSRRSEQSIFVIDDIHWSADMERFWKEVIADTDVHCSIDIYGMGILFFNPDLPKQSYIVAF